MAKRLIKQISFSEHEKDLYDYLVGCTNASSLIKKLVTEYKIKEELMGQGVVNNNYVQMGNEQNRYSSTSNNNTTYNNNDSYVPKNDTTNNIDSNTTNMDSNNIKDNKNNKTKQHKQDGQGNLKNEESEQELDEENKKIANNLPF